MALLFKLAFRNVLRHRRRSILTALSMAGGYILCSFSISLVDGSYGNIIKIFTEDQTGHIQIHKDDYVRRAKIYKTVDELARVESVLDSREDIYAWAPRVFAPALAYAGDESSPAYVTGIDPDREKATSRIDEKLNEGRWLSPTPNPDGYYEALIGRGVADALDLEIGSELILISQGADGSIANDIYIVAGMFGTARSADRVRVILPIEAAQQFLALQGRVHEYAILIDDINEARMVAAQLQSELPELSVSPWQVVQETFYKSMEADKRGNRFTLGVILFIVFIGVLNTVLMSVLERTREFGVLRAIGSRPVNILSLIAVETSILAFFSVIIGFAISVPVVAFFTWVGIEMPEPVSMGGVEFGFMKGAFTFKVFALPVLLIYLYSLIVCIPPGIRAARVSPVTAMRTF